MEQPEVRHDLKELQRLRVNAFSWILRLSTPAHKYLGLVYDAAVSKEVIPVTFSSNSIKVALPELELIDSESNKSASPTPTTQP